MRIYKHWAKQISRFKAIELEVNTAPLYFNFRKVFHLNSGGLSMNFNICNLFGYQFNLNQMCNHIDVRACVILFGVEFSFDFYDVRHWNDDYGTPVVLDEEFNLKSSDKN